MAFSGNYICTSFKQELLTKIHDLSADTIKIALYTSSAALTAATTVYSVTNETSGVGYTAGGKTLAGFAMTTGVDAGGITRVILTWTSPAWTVTTVVFRGALIYNSTAGNKAIAVLDFGSDKTYTAATVTIQMPTADADNALLRF